MYCNPSNGKLWELLYLEFCLTEYLWLVSYFCFIEVKWPNLSSAFMISSFLPRPVFLGGKIIVIQDPVCKQQRLR